MTGLTPFDVWSRSDWGNQEVAGEHHHEKSVRMLLPRRLPPNGVEQRETALLIREPGNRYDRNAVRVEIRGQHVGYLPAEDARRYRAIFDYMAAGGSVPQVRARIWARPEIDYLIDLAGDTREVDSGRIACAITLALPEPHLVLPMNSPPQQPYAILPMASSLMVKTEGISNSVFEPWLNVEGEVWVHVTLHRDVEHLPRSTRERVAVHLNGQLAGYLTPATSNKFLPIVTALTEQGRLCVSPALLRGNKLHVELKICGEKAANLPAEWLLTHANHAVIARDLPEPPSPASNAATQSPHPAFPEPLPTTVVPDGPQTGVPGWFPDPQGIAQFRYWDGTSWSSRIRTRMP